MNHRDPRFYPYDGQHTAWASGQVSPQDIEYMTNGYTYDNSNQYYPSAHELNAVNEMASTSGPYFRSMTPSLVSGHRYPHANRDPRYSPTQGFVSQPLPLVQTMYTHQQQQSQQYPSHCLPMAEENVAPLDHTTQPTRFIPTPSQIAHAYSTYPQHMASPHPKTEFYDPLSVDYTGTSPVMSTNNGLHRRPSRTPSVRSRGGSIANSVSSTSSSPSGERFPCEKCGKTFSRSHDRKRHYETQHLPTPIVHRCVYCHKEFSRADSLKRHLDNGCDEMHP